MQSTTSKLGVWLAAGLLILVPVGYLAANTFSLQQEINALHGKYPKLTDEEIAIVEAVKNTKPSVVSIVIRKEVFGRKEKVLDLGNGLQVTVPGDTVSQGQQVVGQGSGFAVGDEGLIATNKHVVSDKNAGYQVIVNNGTKVDAQVVAIDPVNDLALIKLTSGTLPTGVRPLPLGNSSELEIGQSVIAIGNALGALQNSVTKGIVSALDRTIIAANASGSTTEKLAKIIQTDAAINPGNSGGPLITTAGEVVGINTATNAGAQNIGFAIPVNDLIYVLKSYRTQGRIVRPILGVRYVVINAKIKKQLKLPYAQGVLLQSGDNGEAAVIKGGPADKAGLGHGDIILRVNDTAINDKNDLATVVRSFLVGDTVTLRVWKKTTGTVVTIPIILQEIKSKS